MPDENLPDSLAQLSQQEGQSKPDYAWMLTPLSSDAPAGENLETDNDFFNLDTLATPAEAREYGNFVEPAADIDWGVVLTESEKLLRRTRDLRVLAHWHNAAVATHGIGGLAAGFHVLRVWLETIWEPLHPELEGKDSGARWVCVGSMALAEGLLGTWRRSALINNRMLTLSVRDLLQILGISGGNAQATIGQEQVLSYLRDHPEHGKSILVETRSIQAQIARINELASEYGTSGESVDLSAFDKILKGITHIIGQAIPEETSAAQPETSDVEGDTPSVSSAAPTAQLNAASGCRTRNDALLMIDAICEYYKNCEPAHPAPLFLKRAQRMMRMDFMEIIKELLPTSLDQIEALTGNKES